MSDASSQEERRIRWGASIPFFTVHIAAVVGVLVLGFSCRARPGLALYAVRMFGVTAGYHRYFSHRSFRTSRPFQFVLALLAMSSSQKGSYVAGHHRVHHKFSTRRLTFTRLARGLLLEHVGWILSKKYHATDDSACRPGEVSGALVAGSLWWVPPTALGVGLFAVGGWFGLVWGFLVSTTLLWHGTFTINSLTHMFGSRRYATTDNSRNNAILAVITLARVAQQHHYIPALCPARLLLVGDRPDP